MSPLAVATATVPPSGENVIAFWGTAPSRRTVRPSVRRAAHIREADNPRGIARDQQPPLRAHSERRQLRARDG